MKDIISHRIHVGYIYLHGWLIFMVEVVKYTVRPMDPMVMCSGQKMSSHHPELVMIYCTCVPQCSLCFTLPETNSEFTPEN